MPLFADVLPSLRYASPTCRKKELTDTETKLLDKCKQAQFTGTLTMDAVVAAGSYFGTANARVAS